MPNQNIGENEVTGIDTCLAEIRSLLENRNVFQENMFLYQKIHKVDTKHIYFETARVEIFLDGIKRELENLNVDRTGNPLIKGFKRSINSDGKYLNLIKRLDIANKPKDEKTYSYVSRTLIIPQLDFTLEELHKIIEAKFDDFMNS